MDNAENEVTVTVVLDVDPERTVVIPILRTGQGGAVANTDYSVSATSLTFDAGDTVKTFTFTATSDTVDDDDESVLLQFGTINDDRVTTETPTQSTVSITDDDDPFVKVKFGASSINLGEGDDTTITVIMDEDPERDVVIPITAAIENGASAADYSGVSSTTTVTFTAGGERSQTFTFTATQDRIDDDNERVKLGFGAMPDERVSAENPITQTINIGDDDTRGATVTPVMLSVNEEGSGDYTVVLHSQPTATVTVTPGATSSEVTLSAALIFTTGNWETPQTVTVSAADDADTVNETLTITHTASAGDYGSVTPASVAVSLVDNDTASVFVSTSGVTITEGATGTFRVKLNTQPDTNTSDITITSSDTAVATFAPATLEFNSTNWSTERTVTVTAVQDDGAANNTATITFGVSDYDAVTDARPVTISVEDDDTRAVTISESALAVEEEAATADPPTITYTVVPDTQPTDNVTVGITSDNDDIRVNGPHRHGDQPVQPDLHVRQLEHAADGDGHGDQRPRGLARGSDTHARRERRGLRDGQRRLRHGDGDGQRPARLPRHPRPIHHDACERE